MLRRDSNQGVIVEPEEGERERERERASERERERESHSAQIQNYIIMCVYMYIKKLDLRRLTNFLYLMSVSLACSV